MLYLSHPSGGDIYSCADSRRDIELQWRSWKINFMQISICPILSRLPHAVSLFSPWGSALLLLQIFGLWLSFIWCLADLCSGIALSGVICFGCKYDKLGTDKDFTENSWTLSLFPLSWPRFICCGPKKCIKSFFQDDLSFWNKRDKISIAYKLWADSTPVGLGCCLSACEGFSGRVSVCESCQT